MSTSQKYNGNHFLGTNHSINENHNRIVSQFVDGNQIKHTSHFTNETRRVCVNQMGHVETIPRI